MAESKNEMDVKTIAAKELRSASKRFLQDLDALPESVFTQRFGSATRTVADIVYEVNLVDDHVGMVIRGEEPFTWPDELWIKAPESFRTKDDIVNAFSKSSGKMIRTIESFSPEELQAAIRIEDGETTRLERCRFVTWHINYHSGQLNFIQTLLGDDAMHWK